MIKKEEALHLHYPPLWKLRGKARKLNLLEGKLRGKSREAREGQEEAKGKSEEAKSPRREAKGEEQGSYRWH